MGGRWTPKGVRAIYTAGSLSLAALEMLVHMDVRHSGDVLTAIPADIPDELSLTRVDIKTLPQDWRSLPPPPALQAIGNDWLNDAHTAVLAVPSAVIPVEWNYLLNPAHPDFSRIEIGRPVKFELDQRLPKRTGKL